MSKTTEAFMDRHPSTVELDALRAGSLDSDPDRRAAVLAHLGHCAACQTQNALWPQVRRTLDQQTANDDVAGALAVRRHRALKGVRRASSRPVYFRFAVAAALTAIAIGIGSVFFIETERPETTVAAVEAQSPDLYADLDFYLWLMHNPSDDNSPPNG